MIIYTEATILDEGLKKLTYDLWECLSRVRTEGGTEEDSRCMDEYYSNLRELVTQHYEVRNLNELSQHEMWFTRQVMEAYRELRPSLNIQ